MTNITISEYGYISCDNISRYSKFKSFHNLDKKLFDELYNFWLEDKQTQKVFTFENKLCLKATSYVGVIQTQNLSIEILPKIYQKDKEQHTRDIFISMLKVVMNLNNLQINKANLSICKNKNIFEGFITLFIKSVDVLIHKGIKSDYLSKEENQNFLKGKLKFSQHLKQNYIQKQRFYVSFDEYLPNRVENKLIKSTIKLLLQKTKNHENKKALRQQLFVFDDVDFSYNYKTDISKINITRGMEHYDMALRFAKVFLLDNSFTSLRGKNNVFSLLFPMEKVFEEYLAVVLKNSKDILGIHRVLINGGANEYFLSDKNARLQPDYLLKMKNTKDIIIDAKYKIVEDENIQDNINLNSNDIYQMFAYLNFYDCQDKAYLFVPQTKEVQNNRSFEYNTQDKTKLYHIEVIALDLSELIKDNHRLQKGLICLD